MIDKDILIKHLEDFKNKDNKYTIKQLAEFLSKNTITNDFFQNKVEKMHQYIKNYPKLIVKYSKDKYAFYPPSQYGNHSFSYTYTQEEYDIINEIKENHLISFWFLNLELNDNFDCRKSGKVMQRLAYDVYDSDDTTIEDLIDYIIKFCIIPYEKPDIKKGKKSDVKKCYVLKYFEETDNFTLDSKEFKLTDAERYTLNLICNYSKRIETITSRDVSRINTKAKDIINQAIVSRKTKNKPYQLSKNILYKDY